VKAPGVIYRVGRKPDPWAPPDWASAGPDGTFGNRFDDPDTTYRVLYASSQRLEYPRPQFRRRRLPMPVGMEASAAV
jgi:hypothetical protein